MALCGTVVDAAEVVPMVLVKQSSRAVKIKKGGELPLRIMQRTKLDKKDEECLERVGRMEDEVIEAPDGFRARVGGFLGAGSGVVAGSDRDLGQTNTVKMKIHIGDHPPIKLEPYRTPIHKWPQGYLEDWDYREFRIPSEFLHSSSG